MLTTVDWLLTYIFLYIHVHVCVWNTLWQHLICTSHMKFFSFENKWSGHDTSYSMSRDVFQYTNVQYMYTALLFSGIYTFQMTGKNCLCNKNCCSGSFVLDSSMVEREYVMSGFFIKFWHFAIKGENSCWHHCKLNLIWVVINLLIYFILEETTSPSVSHIWQCISPLS